MKNEDIYNSISEIDGKLINEAEDHKLSEKPHGRVRKRLLISALSAALAVVSVAGIVLYPHGEKSALAAYAIARPEYPEMLRYPEISDENNPTREDAENYMKWKESVAERTKRSAEYAEGMDSFYKKVLPELLSVGEESNAAFSPASMYLALGMLAECTGGDSLAQILDLLGKGTLEEARSTSRKMWLANYIDDGITKSVISNSMWLNNKIDFKEKTLNSIAENYYASSFSGEMGSDSMNKLLREWINENTGQMLSKDVKDIEITPNTAIALVNTLCFSAEWENKFSESFTHENVFHAKSGDVSAEYMGRDGFIGDYLIEENFTAAELEFDFGGKMTFWLPNEGVSVDELLRDEKAADCISLGSISKTDETSRYFLNLRIPKFDIKSNVDMISCLTDLGVKDIFNSDTSDFTPLYNETQLPTFVSDIKNAARVKIDEDGCEGVSYIAVIMYASAAGPGEKEADFILNRPFIFTVTGPTGDILFAGTVGNPTK